MCKKNDKPMTAKQKEKAARRAQWQKNYESTLKVKQTTSLIIGIVSIVGTLATLGIVFYVIITIINALRGA